MVLFIGTFFLFPLTLSTLPYLFSLFLKQSHQSHGPVESISSWLLFHTSTLSIHSITLSSTSVGAWSIFICLTASRSRLFYYFFGLVSRFPSCFFPHINHEPLPSLHIIIFGAVQYLSHQSSTPPNWQLLLQSVYLKFHSLLPPTQTKSLHHHIHPLATTSLTLLPSPPSPIHVGFFSPWGSSVGFIILQNDFMLTIKDIPL